MAIIASFLSSLPKSLVTSMSEETGKHNQSAMDDTPMALLEQLVYMENFLQSAGTSPNTNQTPETNPSSTSFNDQLQRELAAFADDTFIFPDEDKQDGFAAFGAGPSAAPAGGSSGNGGPSATPSRGANDLVSFADATSFNHVSSGIPPSNGSPISNQTYQNLNQRYTNKRRFDYHDAMQSNNGSVGPAVPVRQQRKTQPAVAPIPATIHELLGKKTSSGSVDGQHSSFNPAMLGQTGQSPQPALAHGNSNKVHVPEGAQSTLSAAGLSQTQIDALASLVAFHKPEVYEQTAAPPAVAGLAGSPAVYQTQSLMAQQGHSNSGPSTVSAGSPPEAPVPSAPAQPSNNLLVNLLAQTLANAVQPNQQQSLLSDLMVALANQQAPAQPVQSAVPQQSFTNIPTTHDPLTLLQRQLQSPPQFAPQSPSPLADKNVSSASSTSQATSISTHRAKRKVKQEDSPLNSEEEKRQKVTAASARFRQKKKMKEQEMERSLAEAHQLSAKLESRIQQLEMENRLLKNLVVEKSQRRDEEEVERLRKKARSEARKE